MKFNKIEDHQVISTFTYDVNDEEIMDTFGSLERFKEVLSHQELGVMSNIERAMGDEPTDEEQEAFDEIIYNESFDREDCWLTEMKGGYEVTFDLPDE